MFRTILPVAALVTVLAFAAGCGEGGAGPASTDGTSLPSIEVTSKYSVEMLATALEAAGLSVSRTEEAGSEEFFAGAIRTVLKASDGSVATYTFPTPDAAAGAASAVSADGSTLPSAGGGAAMVEWVGKPHLFIRDRIIALYVSPRFDSQDVSAATDKLIQRTLQSEMGSQFAGG